MRRFTGFLNKIALKDSTFRHLSILTDDERKKMAMVFLQASILPALCWCYTQQNEQQSFSSPELGAMFTCVIHKFACWVNPWLAQVCPQQYTSCMKCSGDLSVSFCLVGW